VFHFAHTDSLRLGIGCRTNATTLHSNSVVDVLLAPFVFLLFKVCLRASVWLLGLQLFQLFKLQVRVSSNH